MVVEGDVEVAPGEPTELQYLVRWADAGAQLPPVASAEGDDADGEQAPAETNLFDTVEDCCGDQWLNYDTCMSNIDR